MHKALFLATLLPLFLTACGSGTAPTNQSAGATQANDVAAIEALQANALEGYKKRDAKRISANHAEDIVLIVPGQPPILGRAAVAKNLESELAPGSTSEFGADKIVVAQSGELAYARGTYRFSYVDPQSKKTVNGNGNYVAIFRKQADGSWKVAEEISSPGGPPPAAG